MKKCMGVVRMNTKYVSTKAINTKNKFVELTQFSSTAEKQHL